MYPPRDESVDTADEPRAPARSFEYLLDASNLTTSQLQMWLGQQLARKAPLYNMALAFTICGELDPKRFSSAFDALVAASDAMRSVFTADDGVPSRRVLEPSSHTLELIDLRTEPDPHRAASAWMAQRVERSFDLGVRLFEAALLRTGDERHIWYLNQHHLISDAWSVMVQYRYLAERYAPEADGSQSDALRLPAFEDFARFERANRQSARYSRAVEHWQALAENPSQPVRFYGVKARRGEARTERITRELGRERNERLVTLAGEPGVRSLTRHLSLFNVFAAVLFAWLHRVSGSERLSLGTPAHNRPSAEFKRTVGLFIELFPLKVDVDEDETFSSLIAKVARASGEFLRFAEPGASSAEAVGREYNVVLNYITASFPAFAGRPTSSQWLHPGAGDRAHDLRVQVHDLDDVGEIQLQFDFNTDVFDANEREAAADQLICMLDELLEDRTQRVGCARLTHPRGDDALLSIGRGEPSVTTRDSVLEMIREQSARTPNAVALAVASAGGARDELSYSELLLAVDALAARLRARGVGSGDTVAVCIPRSAQMVISVLGVLAAGAAYVPLDPAYPEERLTFMLEDCAAGVLLATDELPTSLMRHAEHRDIAVLPPTDDAAASSSALASDGVVSADDLAYVIYTSGSTGRPKGVAVRHRNLAAYVAWARAQYTVEGGADFALHSSLSFDLTVTSLFVPLVSGGRIVLYPDVDDSGEIAIRRVFGDDAVDVVKLTPSHLALVRDLIPSTRRISRLILGGEILTTELARSVVRARQGLTILNEYGPTEATVGCMIHRFDETADIEPTVPIGRPAAGVAIHVLDPERRPVPPGVLGEIYIAGDGVAAGYLSRESLTVERFVPDSANPAHTMYRSGDLGRWRSGGWLELFGRADQQIKVRGARVEPGEIEAALGKHPMISDSVVALVEETTPLAPLRKRCSRCGIDAMHPDANLDNDGVCELCRSFDRMREESMRYFARMDDLRQLFASARSSRGDGPDCMMLLSGGKDSTYALFQLVELGMRPLVFSLDNGFISDGAKQNIRRAVDALGLELVMAHPPEMPAIFRDSLRVHANVCNGCFKAIYTLSMNLAAERGIRYIVTGLSRGQIFETRLADLYRNGIFDVPSIERTILEARKAYHRMDDEVSRCLDVTRFSDDGLFDRVQFVDFYRYCEVPLEEMLDYLATRAPWIRPSDTGRSTNCLINDVGIWVHKRERGYHNYALPYSWDVRLGHKTRDEAMDELDDDIDETKVRRILSEIGLPAPREIEDRSGAHLTAFYVAPQNLGVAELRSFLGDRLPDYMIPSYFRRLERIPLTDNAKVDSAALGVLARARSLPQEQFVPPQGELERTLASVWCEVLGLERVGATEDFVDIGGDSILNIQIVARAAERGIQMTPKQLFDHPTLRDLARVVSVSKKQAGERRSSITPLMRSLLGGTAVSSAAAISVRMIDVEHAVSPHELEQALERCVSAHVALGARFVGDDADETVLAQNTHPQASPPVICVGSPEDASAELARQIDLAHGPLVAAALVGDGGDTARIALAAPQAVLDGRSCEILADDLRSNIDAVRSGAPPLASEPAATLFDWLDHVRAVSEADDAEHRDFWHRQLAVDALVIAAPGSASSAPPMSCDCALDASDSDALLDRATAAYGMRADEIVVAALASTLIRWSNHPAVVIEMEASARDARLDPDRDFSRTVGNFGARYPVCLERPGDGDDPRALLIATKERLRAIPAGGVGFPAVRERVGRDWPQPRVLYRALAGGDSAPGSEIGARALTIDARRRGASVEFSWQASGSQLSASDIAELSQRFMRELHTLVAHCCSIDAGGYTPSDFPQAGLEQAELDELLDEFRGSMD